MTAQSARFAGRYIFVAGLHRTGTSLLGQMLGQHKQIAPITGAPVPENEGCFLQGAIPHTAHHGIPGHYATDPAQHLIEGCPFDTLATRQRMEADWQQWFEDTDDRQTDQRGLDQWRLEKSPVNLIRMRLYQQLFPLSQFVIILRHPEAMAAALAKWSNRSAKDLIDYALDAYDIALDDVRYLHAAYVLRYEDLVRSPDRQLESVFEWLGLDGEKPSQALRDGNAEYSNAQRMTSAQASRAARLGYRSAMTTAAFAPIISHPLRARCEAAQKSHCFAD